MLTLAIDLVLIGVDHLRSGVTCYDRFAHEFDRAGVQSIIVIQPPELLACHELKGSVLSCGYSSILASDDNHPDVISVLNGESIEEGNNIVLG